MTNRSIDIGNSGVTSIMSVEQYRPYPAYKDSGVEWLGESPAHWEVKRLKYAVTLNPPPTEARNRGESLEVSFVPMEAIGEYGGLELTTTKLVGEVYTGYTVENGKGAVATGLVNEIGNYASLEDYRRTAFGFATKSGSYDEYAQYATV